METVQILYDSSFVPVVTAPCVILQRKGNCFAHGNSLALFSSNVSSLKSFGNDQTKELRKIIYHNEVFLLSPLHLLQPAGIAYIP